MLATGALALTTADVAFFMPPPHRPRRPERRTKGAARLARNLVRAFQRELTLATDGSAHRLPRISSRYPY